VTSKTRGGIKYQPGLVAGILLADIDVDCNAVGVALFGRQAASRVRAGLVR
jgi:hypothetical protein